MIFLANPSSRCLARDRRGHGRSAQPWNGYDLDMYADDLVPLPIRGAVTAKLAPGATLKVYRGHAHGLTPTSKQKVNGDILAFIRK
jgi:hypothetical protein